MSYAMTSEHRLRIPGKIEQVPKACNWVVEVAEQMGLGMRDVNQVELAVDEAVTNIIEHAYGGAATNKGIDIIINASGAHFEVTIVDEGPKFDPLNATNPDPAAVLDDRKIGGWGVFFIKKVMDGVDYKYAANRNHLIMTKKID